MLCIINQVDVLFAPSVSCHWKFCCIAPVSDNVKVTVDTGKVKIFADEACRLFTC